MIYDSHIDTPSQLLRCRDIGKDNRYGHVDFPKLRRGGVGGAFFALYTPPQMEADAATRYALQMLAATYDAVKENPSYAAMAFSPADARANEAAGRTSVFIGMENASPIQESLSLLRLFHRMGVRYVTLTHNGDNAVADCAADGSHWGGLSPFGREVVADMNRLGLMIDLSHASDKTFWDCIELSKAPIIASHSCCRSLCSHRRNLTDDMIRALGEKDGYVGINFYPSFLSDDFGKSPEDAALLEESDSVESWFRAKPSDPERQKAWNEMRDRLLDLPRPGVKEVVDHIDYAIALCGEDHVGLGSDFDGIQVAPKGLDNISFMGRVVDEMRLRGYSEERIRKVSGDNLLAVMQRVINCSE